MPHRLLRAAVFSALILAASLAAGCNRKPSPPKTPPATPGVSDEPLTPPAAKPDYSFAAGLEDTHPQVIGFLRTFMETALVGDYTKYRQLVVRAKDPESRARFERILNALKALRIEAIEPVELSGFEPPVYRVLTRVEFLPKREVTLRRGSKSRIAILVLQEQGEWRMMPAPPALQPGEDDAPATTSAPGEPATTSAPAEAAPDYPWERDADY
jgi:hypothetical protein